MAAPPVTLLHAVPLGAANRYRASMNSTVNRTWKVLPHRPIEELAANLWRVEGDLEGMPLKRVMALAKRGDGGLVVHNAIALEDEVMKRIDAWGPVQAIVVPNSFHRLDAPLFADRYPGARVYCPAAARKRVEEVVRVDGTYDDFPGDDVVSLATLEGTGQQEGVMVVRSASGATLVFNDVIFNLPHGPGLSGFIFRYITLSTGGPRVTRVARWFLVKDAPALRAHLERLAAMPDLERVIVSHGRVTESDVAAMIRTAAATLG
jgi:hypothetical protein